MVCHNPAIDSESLAIDDLSKVKRGDMEKCLRYVIQHNVVSNKKQFITILLKLVLNRSFQNV